MCQLSSIQAVQWCFLSQENRILVHACLALLVPTRRLHRRSLRLPTRRKWAQSGYLCTTPSTAQAGAQAGADAGISWS